MTPHEIISDEEIARVHGHANFGTLSPREVVNDGVRKYAVGFQGGHTQLCILREHGLITKPRSGSYQANLTMKGKRYARSIYRDTAPTQAEGAALAIGHLTPEQQADIRSHVAGLTEQEEEFYDAPEHGWTCFHCGQTFKTVDGAELHFGRDVKGRPVCQDEGRSGRRDNEPLETDEGGCVTKRFVIFTRPGMAPEKKGGWLKDEYLIDFLREVMLHDGWTPGFRATVLELTWDNDLWASSASEYLSTHDFGIGPRRARKAWKEAREKHERIYKAAPSMPLGKEIKAYHARTHPSPIPADADADAVAEGGAP